MNGRSEQRVAAINHASKLRWRSHDIANGCFASTFMLSVARPAQRSFIFASGVFDRLVRRRCADRCLPSLFQHAI